MRMAAKIAEKERPSLSHNIDKPAAINGCRYRYELTSDDETQRSARILGTYPKKVTMADVYKKAHQMRGLKFQLTAIISQ